jgi:RNA polymerase sigma-70 factor (ECF subfamily)
MDQKLFRSFYETTAPRLRAYIARSCGSIDLADDILQEVYLRFLKAAPVVTDDVARRGYLYRTADSLVIDHWRRARREQAGTVQTFLGNDQPDYDCGYDTRRAFSRLKPQQRLLLWLAYVEGFDHQEIAVATGIKERSVRVLLFRARKALVRVMNRFGLGPEAV